MLRLLLLLLLLSGTSSSRIVVCIVEDENHILASNVTNGTNYMENVKYLLSNSLDKLYVKVALIRHVVSASDFPWFLLTACEVLSSSCVGVVSVTSRQHAHYIEHWASEFNVPHVHVAQLLRPVSSWLRVDRVKQPPAERKLLQSLLSHLGWTQVAVLVDSRSVDSSSAAGLVTQLSDVYMGSLLFRLFDSFDNSTDMESSSKPVDFDSSHLKTVKDSLFYNILVVSSAESAALILREALRMGMLTRDYYWVIDLPSSHCSELLEEANVKDSNILVVQPLLMGTEVNISCHNHEAKTCKKPIDLMELSTVAKGVEILVRAAVMADYMEYVQNDTENSSICENHQDFSKHRSAVVKALDKSSASNKSRLNDMTTHSICSTDAGQPDSLVRVGSWSESKGLQLSIHPLYRNTFKDFGNITLIVGTQEARPFVQKIDNSSMFEGFCVDILKELARSLNFNYVFQEPPDGEWGAPDNESGNWSGIIGQILSKKVDMGIGPFTITSVRELVIDFTKPFMEDGVGILTKRSSSDAKNMFKMFTPLTPLVWGAIAGCVVLVSLCLYIVEWASPFSAYNLERDRNLSFLESIWIIYGSYVEQGSDPHPRSVSARCLVGFWWLFTIVMTSTYTANLAAFLTVTIETSPVNSLSELAKISNLKPLVKEGSNVKTLFEEVQGGVYEEIRRKMAGMPTIRSNESEEALKLVLSGTHAYMTDASQLEYIMLKDCTTFVLAKELFNTGSFGFVLPEDAPYMDVINHHIMKMQEAGLMDKWRQFWWASPDPCTTTDRTSDAKELDWPSLSGLFYIFLGIAGVSLFVRIFEFWAQEEKLLHFWNRLKSIMRLAASQENGATRPCNCSVSSDSQGSGCSFCSARFQDGGPKSYWSVRNSEWNTSAASSIEGDGGDRESRAGDERERGDRDFTYITETSVSSLEFQRMDARNAFSEPSSARRVNGRSGIRQINTAKL